MGDRLRRLLGQPASRAWFYLKIEGEPWWRPEDILSVSIRRGGDDPIAGVSPSTMEITVRGVVPRMQGKLCSFFISDLTAADLDAGGSGDPADIMPRFTGFVGMQTINDDGGNRQTTTFKCSSLTAAVRASRRRIQLNTNGVIVPTEIRRILEDDRLLRYPLDVESPGGATWDKISAYAETDWRSYGEMLTRLTTDAGILIVHKRNGALRIESMQTRAADLAGSAQWDWPLLRSQALVPTKWVQPVELVAKQIGVHRRTSSGGDYLGLLDPQGELVTHPEIREYDMLHLEQTSDTYRRFGIAKRAQVAQVSHSMTGLSVDLLHLIRQARAGDTYAARTVRQLLRLEEGGPLFFSGDWPMPLRLPLMATGITETITPDDWTFELSLDPPSHALGLYLSETPQAAPRAWDSVLTAWDKTPGTWTF